MKKNNNRKLSKNRRHNNANPDAVVLADLRASRNDRDFSIAAENQQQDETDAIDRLLANSGFGKTAAPAATPNVNLKALPLTAVDDFEPDMAAAFRVEPFDEDLHLQVRPLAASERGNQGLMLRATRDDPQQIEAETFFDDVAFMPAAVAGQEGQGDAAFGLRIEPRIEPDLTPLPESGAAPAIGLMAAGKAGAIPDAPENGLDNGFAAMPDSGEGQETVIPKPTSEPKGGKQLPTHCEYKNGQAKLNQITLILSVVASLSTLVLYFMLMAMQDDLAKLNEMVEIMKEDIQMGRGAEPPVE